MVAAIITFLFSSIQTLGRITMVAWLGAGSIITGGKSHAFEAQSRVSDPTVFVVTIAVGLQDRPSAAPQDDVAWKSDYKLIGSPTFPEAISAVSTLVFTYAGTPAFFNIVAEMRAPQLYTRALIVCQTTVTVVYIICATIVYYFCGSYISTPALGSAGPLIKKVAYGIALPGLCASAILLSHVSTPST